MGRLPKENHGQVIGAAEGGAVEKAQGTNGLVKAAPRHLACEQVQLVGADVFRPEDLGRAAKVPGEGRHLPHVALDGSVGLVA